MGELRRGGGLPPIGGGLPPELPPIAAELPPIGSSGRAVGRDSGPVAARGARPQEQETAGGSTQGGDSAVMSKPLVVGV